MLGIVSVTDIVRLEFCSNHLSMVFAASGVSVARWIADNDESWAVSRFDDHSILTFCHLSWLNKAFWTMCSTMLLSFLPTSFNKKLQPNKDRSFPFDHCDTSSARPSPKWGQILNCARTRLRGIATVKVSKHNPIRMEVKN